MDDWAKIRQLFSTGQHSKRKIGRLGGTAARRGVARKGRSGVGNGPAAEVPAGPTGSTFDAYAAQVRVLSTLAPRMAATTLTERVGWSGSASASVFRVEVRAEPFVCLFT